MKPFKLFLSLFVLLAGLAIVFFFAKFFPSPPGKYIIKITNGGFNPNTIEIPVGKSVVFTNESQEPHWIASNNHPIHELYPEFDMKRPLEPKQQWSFTFGKAGSWLYHDHLSPNLTGKIIVVDNATTVNNLPPEDDRQTLPKNEVTEKVKEIAKTEGAVASWRYFKENYSTKNLEGSHDIAHYIGSLMYRDRGAERLRDCDSSFAFGCFHGLIEEFIASEGIGDLKEVIAICQTLPHYQGQITCYHGIGHGILPYYTYDLPKALPLCDELLSSANQQYCYRGVFMENALVQSQSPKSKDPQWPCSTIEEKYKSSCYGYQMIFLLALYKDDVSKIADACIASGKDEYNESCIRGLGNYIAQRNLTRPQKIRAACNQIQGDNSYRCQISAAAELVFQRQPYETAKSGLCDMLPKSWAQQCIDKIDVQRNIQ